MFIVSVAIVIQHTLYVHSRYYTVICGLSGSAKFLHIIS